MARFPVGRGFDQFGKAGSGSGGSSPVSSVFGRIGAVVAAVGDYLAVPVGGLTGATVPARFVGGTAAGPPVAGTFALADFVISQDGHIYVCTTAGTPGAWIDAGGYGAGGGGAGVASFNTRTGAVTLSKADVTATGLAAADLGAAPLASPALTGSPTAPTQAVADNSTKLATTAYADRAVSAAVGGVPNSFVQPLASAIGLAATAFSQNTINLEQVVVPEAVTLTGITYAPTVSGGTVTVGLYDSNGNRVATSAPTASTTGPFQQIPFTAPYAAAAGVYYIALLVTTGSATVKPWVSYVLSPASTVAGSTLVAAVAVPTTASRGTLVPVVGTY